MDRNGGRHFNVSPKSSRVLCQPMFEIEGSKAVRVTYHGWFILFEVGEKLWQGTLESFHIGSEAIFYKRDVWLSNLFYLELDKVVATLNDAKNVFVIYWFTCFVLLLLRRKQRLGNISLVSLLIAMQTEMCFSILGLPFSSSKFIHVLVYSWGPRNP